MCIIQIKRLTVSAFAVSVISSKPILCIFTKKKFFFFCFWIGIVVSGDFTRRVRHHSASICCQVSNPGSCAHLLLLRFNPEQLIRFSHPYSRPIIFTHYHTFFTFTCPHILVFTIFSISYLFKFSSCILVLASTLLVLALKSSCKPLSRFVL